VDDAELPAEQGPRPDGQGRVHGVTDSAEWQERRRGDCQDVQSRSNGTWIRHERNDPQFVGHVFRNHEFTIMS
jgi:hypothetical protein